MSATSSETLKMVTLNSSDGETFEVEEAVLLQSQTIKHMIEDDCANNAIPLPNVTGKTLSKIIEYCKKHVTANASAATSEDLKAWDADFVKVDQNTLFDMILAANYLDIKSLLDLTCQTVADMIKSKTPEEIRKIFNIKNDFTPEEEEAIRKENQNHNPSLNQITPTDIERAASSCPEPDYSKRAKWLRAAVLGANDGLLSIASLMVGVGAVRTDVKTMALTGLAGLFGGACSMAMGELVSVYSQYDIELAHLIRQHQARPGLGPAPTHDSEFEERKKELPSPYQAAAASSLAFAAGAAVPLLAAAFIKAYKSRLAVVVATVSLALFAFGWLGAVLGRAPPLRPSLRVLVGGWVAMGVTFGLTMAAGSAGI
ncbi:hypothetical protein Cgig2_014732 [Carnegiea gigantea]|uniref:Uncharacterized protein n=1 Tax=Carnegiea gigantea TaxID=171969 RepID=A0A9Q1QSX8_9CARY|nr:hypothetical protein Cgig2_014732 [Carnegiea gigantea]